MPRAKTLPLVVDSMNEWDRNRFPKKEHYTGGLGLLTQSAELSAPLTVDDVRKAMEEIRLREWVTSFGTLRVISGRMVGKSVFTQMMAEGRVVAGIQAQAGAAVRATPLTS